MEKGEKEVSKRGNKDGYWKNKEKYGKELKKSVKKERKDGCLRNRENGWEEVKKKYQEKGEKMAVGKAAKKM